jgi:DNA-binding transcriptional LysR family regulator
LADGTLVEVLADWAPVLPPNHLYYPSRRQPTAAFRAFVDAMRV